jgi:hypothetical protein
MSSALKWVAACVAFAGTASVIACTLLVPYDQLQCSTAADCSARGPAFANSVCVANVCTTRNVGDAGDAGEAGATGPWACLSQPSAPTDPNRQVDVKLVTFDSLHPFTTGGNADGGDDLTLVSYTPLAGVAVAACTPDDPSCTAAQTSVVNTDDSGVAALKVPGNFNGFYYLTKTDFMPELLFPSAHLLASDRSVHYPATILSNTNIAALSSSFGIMSQGAGTDAGPGGILLVTQFDCNDRHAANVAITTSPAGSTVLYTTGGIPSKALTATSADGEAAILGMPTGTATVTATLQGKTPQVVTTADVIMREGTMTWVFLRPRTR